MSLPSLGIKRLLGLHYYVRNLERSREFYLNKLGFQEAGRSSIELEQSGHQRSIVFQSGEIVVTCSTPLGEGGRAHRYLSKHPDGVGTIAFEVSDIEKTFALLEERGGTAITDVKSFPEPDGNIETFSITTPFGDTTFRFTERKGAKGIYPGMEPLPVTGSTDSAGLFAIDHVTSNFQTMKPALLWLEHVMGFEPLWEVEFHTRDVAKYEIRDGSGLRSKVMWEPESGIKFANNEPYRPAFKLSQINQFYEEHRGDGVQHAALATRDIIGTVETLKRRGVELMPTPRTYYEALPERLERLGIELEEELGTLEELGILVDGSGPGRYLLQIFLRDSAGLYHAREAGPFFFEVIQRKGDQGFGAGNFRALFESIEREQHATSGGS
ncbi:MAG TPA: VOC family protein [Polyangiaceae bacterium]|jgi:4-hydroxyphenylpyruvate dioxygenase|nr:VOC family protein [Polyangiaceae bacterium]